MTRFGIAYELDSIDSGLATEQGEWGVTLQWYRWDPESPVDDVYDVGDPRQWGPPIDVPVQFALLMEGSHIYADRGLKAVNTLAFALSQDVFRDRLGWGEELDRGRFHQKFLKDRVSYRGQVFTIDSLEPSGNLSGQDVMISGGGREVREDVLFLQEEPVEG
ncbi:MAG: hypothetical protein ABR616_09695 [Dermatophilaceae bacterium]|nr:hypothetical protein [Intrasporangiaceae bacterium]